MKLADTREIKASPATVWTSILDPAVLMACIPGCESMTGSPAEGFEAVVVQKIGPVKARFTGVVTLSDMVEGKSCRIAGEGKGGPAGFAKGGAVVTFDPIPGGTRMTYEVEASVGGKLAQLGSRLVDGIAKKLADEFFARFQETVEGPADEAPAAEAEASAAPAGKKKSWLKRLFASAE